MKNVLVVDDEETLLMIMVGRFEDYSNQFNVFTAHNGKEAIKIIESETIDLVVTDLKMPEMDGVELLAYLNNKWPNIAAIACSAYCTPEIKETLEAMGTLKVMDKPVDFDLLAQSVLKGLEKSHEGGSINCISLSSFVQIIQMEEKTCMLEVHGASRRRGFLYLVRGELYNAECEALSGEEAAFEMLAWENPQLFLKDLPPGKNEQKITKKLMSIVMEGLRRKDEAEAAKKTPKVKKTPEAQKTPAPKATAKPPPVDDPDELKFLEELEGVLDVLDGNEANEASDTDSPNASPSRKTTGTVGTNASDRLFSLLHGVNQNGQRLNGFFKELQDLIPIDLAVLMTAVKNKPGYVRVDAVTASEGIKLSKGAVFSCENSNLAAVMKDKTPKLIEASRFNSAMEKELFSGQGLKSCLYIPLLKTGQAVGSLVLASKQTIDLDAVAARADWVAGAISLAFERDRLAAEHARQKEALFLVEQIGRGLISWGFDVDKVLRYSLEKIKGLMQVEAGTLFLKEQDHLKVVAAFNTQLPAVKKFRLKIGQGIAGYVAAKGKSTLINDTEKTSRFFRDIDKQTGFKSRTVLCVPLTTGKKIIGVLEVLNKTSGDFNDADELLLESVASAMSTALINTQMYKEALGRGKG